MEELCLILMDPEREKRPVYIEEVMEFLKKYHKFGGAKKTFKLWLNECLDEVKQRKLCRQSVKKENATPRKKGVSKSKSSDVIETAMIYIVIILGCGVSGALIKIWLQGKIF